MQDLIGSVRRSFVLRTSTSAAADNENDGGRFGGFVEKLGSTIHSSRIGLFTKSPSPPLKHLLPPPPPSVSKKDDAVPIQWSKGECIGAGAFGRVYIGMNFDSGGFIAIKQVSIAANSASKEKTQAHIRELEEEVNLLKNLSHPNIVRYLGTAREETSLNILLEFVPGGSISSVLGKFGSFPERVIKMYTKQLLLGLEYLHKNGIMHRDIKGANILVDNDGCIKLADFGASKKVVELATITGAKSMKGTPYWMAPEVILQTGHSFSADIWSVGCTIIEMATGKPPWSQQYQEVAALFYIGTTKSHPPIPEHLSVEAKDFLLRCLQKEPNLRPSASDLLQHPFLTGENLENHLLFHTSLRENPKNSTSISQMDFKSSMNPNIRESCNGLKSFCGTGRVGCSTVYPDNYSGGRYFGGSSNCDDDMCIIDNQDDFSTSTSTRMDFDCLSSTNINKSFNPMREPPDDWHCKLDRSLELDRIGGNLSSAFDKAAGSPDIDKGENEFSFPCGPFAAEEDDEVTESKIKAFLDEKALDLKKLQTPLYEEFYKTVNAACPPCALENADRENGAKFLKMLPPKFKSPNKSQIRRFSSVLRASNILSPGKLSKCPSSNANGASDRTLREIQSPPQLGEWKDSLPNQQEIISPRSTFSDRQRKWKEELDEELERTRAMMRQAGVGSKTASPKDPKLNRQGEHFAFPGR